jgi:DNA-directed RNA polymerase alpha subunit
VSDRCDWKILPFSARAYNTLLNADVETLEQLLAMDRKSLLKQPNCGRVTLREIEHVLATCVQQGKLVSNWFGMGPKPASFDTGEQGNPYTG